MKIVCISDTHNYHKRIKLPDGDVIVHTGDFSSRGYEHELENFTNWYGSLVGKKYKHVILIAGNHDKGTEAHDYFKQMCARKNIIYLMDSSVTIDGVKFHGSPVSPRFGFGWAWNSSSNCSNKIIELFIKFRWIFIFLYNWNNKLENRGNYGGWADNW